MRRKVLGMLCTLCLAALTACGTEADTAAGRNVSNTKSVDDVLKARLDEEQNDAETKAPEAGAETDEQDGQNAETATETVTDTETADETAAGTEKTDETEMQKGGTEFAGDTGNIDVDLTVLSSTMVYSEVSNMMTSPEEYVGKKVKMEGAYSLYKDPDSGNEYRACIIQDATACCAQGIEFETASPEDCPGEGENVTVVGLFDTYYEGEYMYCTLRDAVIL